MFSKSTHYHHWILKQEEVNKRRYENLYTVQNQTTLSSQQETKSSQQAIEKSTSKSIITNPVDQQISNEPQSKRPRLTNNNILPEEMEKNMTKESSYIQESVQTNQYINGYFSHLAARQTMIYCKQIGLDRAIMTTALYFVHRLYLMSHPKQFDPIHFLHTCIFLAIKTEACPYTEVAPLSQKLATTCMCSVFFSISFVINLLYVSLKNILPFLPLFFLILFFFSPVNLSDAELVSYEIPLLMSLSYELSIHQPIRVLRPLFSTMIRLYIQKYGIPNKEEKKIFLQYWDHLQKCTIACIDILLTTDAILVCTPAIITAAAFILAIKLQKNQDEIWKEVYFHDWFDADTLNVKCQPLSIDTYEFLNIEVRKFLTQEIATTEHDALLSAQLKSLDTAITLGESVMLKCTKQVTTTIDFMTQLHSIVEILPTPIVTNDNDGVIQRNAYKHEKSLSRAVATNLAKESTF